MTEVTGVGRPERFPGRRGVPVGEVKKPCGSRRETQTRGNLTLLTAAENRQLGPMGYVTKMDIYRKSVYALTRAVVDAAPETWTWPLLEKRQQRLADRAVHVWRVDY